MKIRRLRRLAQIALADFLCILRALCGLFLKETTPTVVDHHEFKWNADLPDSHDHFYQADQGNLRPIFRRT